MPVDVQDIQRKAEISHSTVSRAIALETVGRIQCLAREKRHVSCHKIQGGLEVVAPSLITCNSFLKSLAEVLSDSIYSDDVSALSVKAAFT